MERWFADPYAMIADDGIDLITVAVKVPAHKGLVLAALKAGKAVYSSPCGRDVVGNRGDGGCGGLAAHRDRPAGPAQSRGPSSGRVGRVRKARPAAVGTGRRHDLRLRSQSTQAYDYFNKAASGATFLITTGHVLDVIEAVLGSIVEVDARTELLWPEIEIVDTGETSGSRYADDIDLIAKTELASPSRRSGWARR